jgi:hypothetical protein
VEAGRHAQVPNCLSGRRSVVRSPVETAIVSGTAFKEPMNWDGDDYKGRIVICNARMMIGHRFCRLKQLRGPGTRFDKRAIIRSAIVLNVVART